jgi:hypothetical protein
VQTENDVETVQDLVTEYIKEPRTIILAVIQASNDIANQSIVRKSKAFDKDGRRTVGVITKPDLTNPSAAAQIALLAKGLDTTKLKLGFYLLKNLTTDDLAAGITASQRETIEMKFFTSSPWKEQDLDYNRVGIAKLKENLQTLLDEHISRELPKVREDIKARLKSVQEALAVMPLDRPSPIHKRMFLSDLAIKYQRLTTAALDGDYSATGTGNFFNLNDGRRGKTRLRAEVHSANTSFATYMRVNGRKTVVRASPENRKSIGTETNTTKQNATTPLPKLAPSASKNSVSLFGSIGATSTSSGSGLAQTATTNHLTDTAGGFGSGTAGGFGPTAGGVGSTAGGFGSTTVGFGSTAGGLGSTPGGGFGSNTAAGTAGGLFGARPAANTAAGGLFGARPAANAAAAGLFGAHPALPAATNGTSGPPFELERDLQANQTISYQSITCSPTYKPISFEELRLNDYEQGRGHVNKKSKRRGPSTPAKEFRNDVGVSPDKRNMVQEITQSSHRLATDQLEGGEVDEFTDNSEHHSIGKSRSSIDSHDSAAELDEAVRVLNPAEMKAWVFEVRCPEALFANMSQTVVLMLCRPFSEQEAKSFPAISMPCY